MNEKYRLPRRRPHRPGGGGRRCGRRSRSWLARFERDQRERPLLRPDAYADRDPSADTDRPALDAGGSDASLLCAFSKARKTNDPSLVEPYVTSKESSAYLTAAGFLGGAQGVNRASIVTVDRLDNMTSQVSGDTATVDFDYTEGGYDINPSTGAALESPTVLAAGPRHGDLEARQRPLAHGLVRRRTNETPCRLGLRCRASRQHHRHRRMRSEGYLDPQVVDWTSPDGHAFVGVQANGQWATPSSSGYCSVWQLKAVVAPNEWVYWVWVYQNGCSGQAVNFTNPLQVITTPGQAGHGDPREYVRRHEPVSRRVGPAPGRARDEPAHRLGPTHRRMAQRAQRRDPGLRRAELRPGDDLDREVRRRLDSRRFRRIRRTRSDSRRRTPTGRASSTSSSSRMSPARPTAPSSRPTGRRSSSSFPSRSTSATLRAASGRRSSTSRPS